MPPDLKNVSVLFFPHPLSTRFGVFYTLKPSLKPICFWNSVSTSTIFKFNLEVCTCAKPFKQTSADFTWKAWWKYHKIEQTEDFTNEWTLDGCVSCTNALLHCTHTLHCNRMVEKLLEKLLLYVFFLKWGLAKFWFSFRPRKYIHVNY